MQDTLTQMVVLVNLEGFFRSTKHVILGCISKKKFFGRPQGKLKTEKNGSHFWLVPDLDVEHFSMSSCFIMFYSVDADKLLNNCLVHRKLYKMFGDYLCSVSNHVSP